MKIKFEKSLVVVGVKENTSAKGNIYFTLVAFDENGDVFKIYCNSDKVSQVVGLEKQDEIIAELQVTYSEKYDRLELIHLTK